MAAQDPTPAPLGLGDPVPGRHHDRRVVVTGAASGIGRATALRLGAEGARVLCADLAAEAVAATAADIVAAGGEAVARTTDVSQAPECEALVAEAVERWGGLDALCNVAGVLRSRHFPDTTDGDWRLMMGVNLDGPFYCCRAAVPHLLASRGAIVNVASAAGMMGQSYFAGYSASKHGLVGLTRSLAIEYARSGMRANAVCPGGVDTSMTQAVQIPDDVDFSLLLRANITDEMQPPESPAGLVAWLASDEARYVNGGVYAIDCGITAG